MHQRPLEISLITQKALFQRYPPKADTARSVCFSSESGIDFVDLHPCHRSRASTAPAKLA
jgi:hypothetical protein